jgi:hypothetical protein
MRSRADENMVSFAISSLRFRLWLWAAVGLA